MLIPEGFKFSACACGIRKKDKLDLGLILCEGKGISWGVFTKNSIKAAPVVIGMKHVKNPITKAILANSGVANACTGEEGLKNAMKLLEEVSRLLGIKKEEILPASTGVIGEQLPLEKILPKLSPLIEGLSEKDYLPFAQAIMTTDTFPKIVSKTTEEGIVILGIAKGAGMIAPRMATMLAFILTDAVLTKEELKRLLGKCVEDSFNRVTIDGDTSTNDTVYAMSSGVKAIKNFEAYQEAFSEVLKELSYLIVKDGEGASKVIKIWIKGAKTKEEAKILAKSVAESLLVKTAFYGEDPNWGRIFAALGKTGIALDPEEIELYINNLLWIKSLKLIKEEAEIKREMAKPEIELIIKLKRGNQNYWVLTNDLTDEYIKINASYRS
ncbi:MAG: bifunctional glutamate N-acetyltransferase/amino-acid acetyltransferase ArgJ [Caldimicrobium sp.]